MVGVVLLVLLLAVVTRVTVMYHIVGRDRIHHWNDWPTHADHH